MDRDAFDSIMSRLDTAMAVVTTATANERAGCLVGFHCQCSIEPVRYAVWLSKANHTARVALHASHAAVHYLAAGDRELAAVFGELTGDEVDKFDLVATSDGPHGVPLLDECADRVLFRKTAFLDEGSDHVCFVLEPEEVLAGPRREGGPLRMAAVSDMTPGHEAEERPAPATDRATRQEGGTPG
jgi:flavin reductase (DIM6/NTAB) family NADH-FMN oxidoreductase RutF